MGDFLNRIKRINWELLVVIAILTFVVVFVFSCSVEEQCDCYEISRGPSSTTSDTQDEWEILREFEGDCSRDGEWVRDEHNSIAAQIRCR